MKATERERKRVPAGNDRDGSATVREERGRRALPGDDLARARAIARWENEGGRVLPAPRELPGKN
jgi:hypothetical protein